MTEAIKQIEKDLAEAQKLVEEAVEKGMSKRTYQKRLRALSELFWAKERMVYKMETDSPRKQMKCRLDIPRDWYQKQLNELEAIENKTKVNYDKISVYRAKLRYYDAHIDEANSLIEFKKDLMELGAWKKVFKENKNKKLWKQCCTIEKMVKEKGIEAKPVVKHALEVIHNTFGRN